MLRIPADSPLLPLLRAHAEVLQPKLITIDTSADAFGGNEIDRAQVRHFVKLLRGVAIENDSTVLLLSHPSVAGIATWLKEEIGTLKTPEIMRVSAELPMTPTGKVLRRVVRDQLSQRPT